MKWLFRLLRGASFTTALFIFQACYGTPSESIMLRERGEAPMTFSILSKTSGEPLGGIRVLGAEYDAGGAYYEELGITGSDGRCHVNIPYIRNQKGPFLRFEDPSEIYSQKDTVLYDLQEREIVIKL
jgi:hypothetical protein